MQLTLTYPEPHDLVLVIKETVAHKIVDSKTLCGIWIGEGTLTSAFRASLAKPGWCEECW